MYELSHERCQIILCRLQKLMVTQNKCIAFINLFLQPASVPGGDALEESSMPCLASFNFLFLRLDHV